MYRGWGWKEEFEFNSEDTSGHPWGDFIVIDGEQLPLQLTIDGNDLILDLEDNYCYLAFHRDRSGMITHLVPTNDLTLIAENCDSECIAQDYKDLVGIKRC